MFRLQFRKRFDLRKARIVDEKLKAPDDGSGDSISVKTLKVICEVMELENTVLSDIAKENAVRMEQVTSLNEDITSATEAERMAKERYEIALANLKKMREEQEAANKARVEENTENIQDLHKEISKTNELSVYG